MLLLRDIYAVTGTQTTVDAAVSDWCITKETLLLQDAVRSTHFGLYDSECRDYTFTVPGWAHTVATSNLKLPNILFDLRKFLDCRTCDGWKEIWQK